MRTGGCMGEIVGMAASLCRKHQANPRAIYAQYFDELEELMWRGAGKGEAGRSPYINQGERTLPAAARLIPPDWLSEVGPNAAPRAMVTVSGSRDASHQPPALITDGRMNLTDNGQRWLSGGSGPVWIELNWDHPEKVEAVRVISGYRESGGAVIGMIEDFVLRSEEGQGWRDIPGAKASGNKLVDWHARFPALETSRLRLNITATPDSIARIWEVQVFQAR